MVSYLLYDADCGFCTATAGWLRRRGMTAQLRPLASADASWELDQRRAMTELPFRHPSGRFTWGAEAIADALATCPAPLRLLGRLLATRVGLLVARPCYRLVARNRHRLPGGTGACRVSHG